MEAKRFSTFTTFLKSLNTHEFKYILSLKPNQHVIENFFLHVNLPRVWYISLQKNHRRYHA